MKTILSVFDTTGQWSQPYDDDGQEVIACDIKNPFPVDVTDFNVEWFFENAGIESVDGMLLAPPCTDFTNAGAQYWPAKDRDGRTQQSVELALQALRAVELFRPDFWALENPIGRLPKLVPQLGGARLTFDPCDYAGHLDLTPADIARLDALRARNGLGEWTTEEIEFVKATNAYTKKTMLWGDFVMPEKRRIEPVKVCAQGSWLQRLGGKSEKTKAARSVTPEGFARAFFAANNWTGANADLMQRRQAAAYALTVLDRRATDAEIVDVVAGEFGDDLATIETVAEFRKKTL